MSGPTQFSPKWLHPASAFPPFFILSITSALTATAASRTSASCALTSFVLATITSVFAAAFVSIVFNLCRLAIDEMAVRMTPIAVSACVKLLKIAPISGSTLHSIRGACGAPIVADDCHIDEQCENRCRFVASQSVAVNGDALLNDSHDSSISILKLYFKIERNRKLFF